MMSRNNNVIMINVCGKNVVIDNSVVTRYKYKKAIIVRFGKIKSFRNKVVLRLWSFGWQIVWLSVKLY